MRRPLRGFRRALHRFCVCRCLRASVAVVVFLVGFVAGLVALRVVRRVHRTVFVASVFLEFVCLSLLRFVPLDFIGRLFFRRDEFCGLGGFQVLSCVTSFTWILRSMMSWMWVTSSGASSRGRGLDLSKARCPLAILLPVS